MRGDHKAKRNAWRAGALCLALAAGWAAQAQAQTDRDKPRVVRMAAAGFWSLGLVKTDARTAMCVASTQDNGAKAMFDYLIINRDFTAFRVSGDPIKAAPDAAEALYVLRVDRREAIAVKGRRMDGIALLPVPKDDAAKRRFVRDLAEGRKLEIRDDAGALIGQFQLAGADKVLRALGLCVARLPKFAPPE